MRTPEWPSQRAFLFGAFMGFFWLLALQYLSHSLCAPLGGVFVSSWVGSWLLDLGEWTIKKLPLIRHIYSASKQVGPHVQSATVAIVFLTSANTQLQAGGSEDKKICLDVPKICEDGLWASKWTCTGEWVRVCQGGECHMGHA